MAAAWFCCLSQRMEHSRHSFFKFSAGTRYIYTYCLTPTGFLTDKTMDITLMGASPSGEIHLCNSGNSDTA